MASLFLRFLNFTQRRTTVGRTPLDERSPRRRDLYLTTHNKHNRQISMPPVGFEPTISVGEMPQTYALDRAATGTGSQSGRGTKIQRTVPFIWLPPQVANQYASYSGLITLVFTRTTMASDALFAFQRPQNSPRTDKIHWNCRGKLKPLGCYSVLTDQYLQTSRKSLTL